MIAFKLERYVIPVMPIFILFLFAGMQQFADRSWLRWSYRVLIFLNALMIFPVALTMQQRAGVDGAIYAGRLEGVRIAHRIDPWRWAYYGFNRRNPIFTSTMEELIAAANGQQDSKLHIFRFMYFSQAELAQLESAGLRCRLWKIFRPDFLERVSIRLNPAMNGRRNDTTIYSCQTPKKG